jgi:hypothetical protein
VSSESKTKSTSSTPSSSGEVWKPVDISGYDPSVSTTSGLAQVVANDGSRMLSMSQRDQSGVQSHGNAARGDCLFSVVSVGGPQPISLASIPASNKKRKKKTQPSLVPSNHTKKRKYVSKKKSKKKGSLKEQRKKAKLRQLMRS